MDLETLHDYGEELEKRLRLRTFPLAIRLLRKEEDLPAEAHRPLRDYGHHLTLCQSYQISRRDGATIAMLKEDNWCFEPVVGYGLEAAPEYFMQGYNRFPDDVGTIEAGATYAAEFPRLETGRYSGIVSAPLAKASFEPDVILLYCDPEQLSLLLLAREYQHGRNLKCSLSSHAACVYAVVPAISDGTCQVALPCRGDHYGAMAGYDEMIFSIPKGKAEGIMIGLRQVERNRSGWLPKAYRIRPEYPVCKSYEKLGEMVGLDMTNNKEQTRV